MEDLIMKLYREIGNCNLWNEIGGVYHKKESQKNIGKVRKGLKREKNGKKTIRKNQKIILDENIKKK